MGREDVVEGRPFDFGASSNQAVRDRLERLRADLRPRLPFVVGGEGRLVIQNLVGSVQVTPDLILDIRPKTEAGEDWAVAVIDLLADERASVEVETRRAERRSRRFLVDALAARYVDELDRALRREGPLLVLERRHTNRPALAGRLDVTAWVKSRVLHPETFPQTEALMTADNAFSSAMVWVAQTLAVRSSDPRLAGRLRSISVLLRPGLPPHAQLEPGVELRNIPTQWRGYQSAWTIAKAVMRRIAPLHRSGALDGLGLAIEPWPLLERLLTRSLNAAARIADAAGDPLIARRHTTHSLLRRLDVTGNPSLARLHSHRSVEPDGSLWRGSDIVATFEAKYSSAASDATFRSHYFQALTTAAAVDSPLAILVYPEASEPVSWDVMGFNGTPARLVAIGLDMYGYRSGLESERATILLEVLRDAAPALA